MAKKRKSRTPQPSSVEEQEQEQQEQGEDPQPQDPQTETQDDVIDTNNADVIDTEHLPDATEEVEEEEEEEYEEEEEEPKANEEPKPEEEEELEPEPVEKLLEPFTKEQLVVLLKEAVEKHPEFLNSVTKIADTDPSHRKIFVHGLGWDTTADVLISEFSKFGDIEDCKAVVDKVSGKSKGYAFILFKHRAGCKKALLEPQKKIGNRVTSCQLASAGPVPTGTGGAGGVVAAAAPVSEVTQRKIFVSNVAADIDPGKLLEFFGTFGEVEDGPLGLDKVTGKPRGFALFVYKSVDGAKKALEEPHKIFEGHTLNVQKAVDGPKPSSKGFFQQGQQQYGGSHGHHAKKGKYSHGGGGGQGHMMAPSGPSSMGGYGQQPGGLNPALGQALSALLTQGGGLGNLLGLAGQPQGMPGAGGYGNQGYGGGYPNPQGGGQGGNRHHQGGGNPYMGHGR